MQPDPGGQAPPQAGQVVVLLDLDVPGEVLAFGDDYARTLRTWRAAFEARIDSVRAQRFDETFIRTWRLYLAYCEAGFAERRTDVMHFIVSSGG